MSETTRGTRSFYVQKDDGSEWAMAFSPRGLDWIPLPPRPQGPRKNPPTPAPHRPRTPGSKVETALLAAVQMAELWERRQQRLTAQAAVEESRRTEWLADMIGRWAQAHASGDIVDLRLTEYVAREAHEMLKVIVENKRITLPQSMLYELNSIQNVVQAYSEQLLAQFEMLAASPEVDLRGAVHAAMPHRALDMGFIRSLATNPEADWSARLAARSTTDFDRDLSEVWRSPAAFYARLYPSTELAVFEPVEPAGGKGVVAHLLATILPALPRIPVDFYKQDQAERLDHYREMLLLPTQVARARALTAAWLSVCELLETSGRTITIESGPEVSPRQLSAGASIRSTAQTCDFQLTVTAGHNT